MDNANTVYERRNANGTVDYIVSIGDVLYNDRVLTLNNLIIPISSQSFFTLPEDKDKYAAVDAYYVVETGSFVFNVVQKSSVPISSVNSTAISNALPLAQFLVKESLGRHQVVLINQYSKMSTFSISNDLTQGDRGSQGPLGVTGFVGETGLMGETGDQGSIGETGIRGETGLGLLGATGLQGETGVYPDLDLLLYCKFKSNDFVALDYSAYERDLTFGATSAGFTGIGWTGLGLETGYQYFDRDPSQYTTEPGIVDNCSLVEYVGGISSYKKAVYLGFTGTIQAWVNVALPPIADFSYAVDISNPLQVSFVDSSQLNPTQWSWEISDGASYVGEAFTYVFSSSGSYLVTLTVTNGAGQSRKTKHIVV